MNLRIGALGLLLDLAYMAGHCMLLFKGVIREIGVIKRYSDIFLVVLFLDTSICSSLRHKSQYEEPWS